jgi:glutamate mutase epsilon subunit
MSQSGISENLQKNVRKYIFEHFEEHTTAPVLEQIMGKFGLDRASAFKVLVDLQSARHIALLAGTQRILMAFPFSSIVTPFSVKITEKEREYFANCAWDAVAIHVALGKEQ